MDIDKLKAFCELAKVKNYRLASEKLFITQSALTKKIQRLEKSLGTMLFERGRNGAELTQVGKTIFPEAKRIVTSFNQFSSLTSVIVEGKKGYLNIGYGVSTYAHVPSYIADFKSKYSDIYVTLEDIPSLKQTEAIFRGDLQISFTRLPVAPPLQGIHLFDDHLVIAVHSSIKLDENDHFSSLLHLDYMRLKPIRGPGLNKQIDKYLFTHGINLTIARESNDLLTLLSMVSANIGYAIVPASVIKLKQDRIKFININDASSRWGVGMVWNSNILDPLRDRFIHEVSHSIETKMKE